MNESRALGRCRKYAVCTKGSGGDAGQTYLGIVQRSGQEYVFPPGNFISLRAHSCSSKEGDGGSAVLRVKSYHATHMYECGADMLVFGMPYNLETCGFLLF